MSVYQLLSTNLASTTFIKAPTFLNGHLVDNGDGRHLGRQKKSFVFSVEHPSVYCLPSICKKRKRGGIGGVAGTLPEVLEQLVDSRQRSILNAIEALTTGYLEHNGQDVTTTAGLLQRSCSHELREIEAALGAKGQTRLFAIADAIDEALEALEEASQ